MGSIDRGWTALAALALTMALAFLPAPVHAQITGASGGEAVLEGVVTNHETGAPIAGAEVGLLPTWAKGEAVGPHLTDDEGRFGFTRVAPGAYVLRVGALGYQTREDTLELAPQTVTRVGVELSVAPIPLDPLSVEVEAQPWRSWEMEMFERRRARRAGRFFDREDLDERLAYRVSDVLRTVPSVGILNGTPENLRTPLGVGRCPMPVFVDGIRTVAGFDSDLPIDMIEGIEVYTNIAEVPVQYRTGPCGAVLIWLRTGPVSAVQRPPGYFWRAVGAVLGVAALFWAVSR